MDNTRGFSIISNGASDRDQRQESEAISMVFSRVDTGNRSDVTHVPSPATTWGSLLTAVSSVKKGP